MVISPFSEKKKFELPSTLGVTLKLILQIGGANSVLACVFFS